MLDLLKEAEQALPKLLQDTSRWQSLYIDYHPPYVERLWCSWQDIRIQLHKIHPCSPGEALFHPHPWPSAMLIVAGHYEMAFGFGSGDQAPPFASRMLAGPGFRYEMTHQDSWHFVRPIDDFVYTIMLTGKPWKRSSPKPSAPLSELDEQQREELFAFFRKAYPLY